jgi:hypothetical protein
MLPATLAAQGTVRGVLYDSLRTHAPVARAMVVLFGTARRDTTDPRGRFEFASVAAGQHSVGFWAPWLDSLAVPALRAEFEIPTDARRPVDVMLATPSRETAQRALCGATLASGTTIVLGEVRDAARAPLADVPVYGWWHETVLGKGQLDRRTMATGDTTDATGMYVLCGIPRGAAFEVHAVREDSASGSVAFEVLDAFIRRDLTIARASSSMLVSGRLVASENVPVADAEVRLRSDSLVTTRSLADGTFRLRVPARTGQIQVRAVGFAPREEEIEPRVGAEESSELRLGELRMRTVQELGKVNIVADGWNRERLEFEERRKFNFQGTFFDDEELKRLPTIRPSALAGKVPRSRMDSRGLFYLERNAGWCKPRIFIDGVDYGNEKQDPRQGELKFWLERAKRIEVYRAAFAPARYTDFDGCGVVVISTK